jgi:hypothetical protein
MAVEREAPPDQAERIRHGTIDENLTAGRHSICSFSRVDRKKPAFDDVIRTRIRGTTKAKGCPIFVNNLGARRYGSANEQAQAGSIDAFHTR